MKHTDCHRCWATLGENLKTNDYYLLLKGDHFCSTKCADEYLSDRDTEEKEKVPASMCFLESQRQLGYLDHKCLLELFFKLEGEMPRLEDAQALDTKHLNHHQGSGCAALCLSSRKQSATQVQISPE